METDQKIVNNLCSMRDTTHVVKPDDTMFSKCDYLYKNFHKLSDIEIEKIHNKVFNDINKKKKELLFYELENYDDSSNNDKNISRDELIKKVKQILARYQPCVSEYYEDDEWNLFSGTNTKYDISDNCIIFDNSISEENDEKDELEKYILLMTKKLKSISNNVSVRFCVLNDTEHGILWHSIKFKFIDDNDNCETKN